MKSFKVRRIILSVAEILLGVLFLANPEKFMTGIITVIGVLLFIGGIIDLVKYFREDPADAAKEHGLSSGLIALIIGLFCIIKNGWFIETFAVITAVFGVGILILGVMKIQWTVDMIRLKASRWYLVGISAILMIVLAIVIISNPFTTTAVLWTFFGISLIVEAVLDILTVILVK